MNDDLQYLFTAAVAAAIVARIFLRWQHGRSRTETLRAVATRMGFEFEPSMPRPARDRFGALPLFERGHQGLSTNVSSGRVAGEPVTVLDYSFNYGDTTWQQTAAVFTARREGLPDFELHPRDMWFSLQPFLAPVMILRSRAAEQTRPYWKRSNEAIALDHSPEFSKRWLLFGDDPAATRAFFSLAVVSALRAADGWSVEAHGGVTCAYRPRKRCIPENLPIFLADARRLVNAFMA